MTKEIRDICRAYHAACAEGKRSALATVVKVVGSSYRRPGARMLVREDGQATGAISGGCLEGSAMRKALFAMEQGKNKLALYDTRDEENGGLGVQLGCRGAVYILFEPIIPGQPAHPIALLEMTIAARQPSAVTVAFSPNVSDEQPGTCVALAGQQMQAAAQTDDTLAIAMEKEARAALAQRRSSFCSFERFLLFSHYCEPPVRLVIAGAGNDAMPLANLAHDIGFDVTVVDGRATHATSARFAPADKVQVVKPGEMDRLESDRWTAFLLMSHNYVYDKAVMERAIGRENFYIGLLGPKSRLEEMLADVEALGTRVTEVQRERIYGPAGLDIGAETPEEIALCILAEIKAVAAGSKGGSLRARHAAIHDRTADSE